MPLNTTVNNNLISKIIAISSKEELGSLLQQHHDELLKLQNEKASLLEALEDLLVAEKLDDDAPALVAARKLAAIVIAKAKR